MTRHAVVTGGAGFIGSHLVDSLLNAGCRVTSLDNFGSGRPSNLVHVEDARLVSLTHDVREPFPDFDLVDAVYHLASRASPATFESHGVEIAMTNSVGTFNAFEGPQEHDAPVLLASTCEVYGNPDVHPQGESYNVNVNVRGPRAPYDESKRFAEDLAVAYARQYGLDVRPVRIFHTYGPRMRPDDGRVIPNFCSQALRGEDLTVKGDGYQTRSFCYVDDLVAGIRTCADAAADDAGGEVFNLGSTDEVAIADLADLVIDLVDADIGTVREPLSPDDPEGRRPDVSRTRDRLHWEPSMGLREGLNRTLDYFEGGLA